MYDDDDDDKGGVYNDDDDDEDDDIGAPGLYSKMITVMIQEKEERKARDTRCD